MDDQAAEVKLGFSDSATPWDRIAAVKFDKKLDQTSLLTSQKQAEPSGYGSFRDPPRIPDRTIRRFYSSQTEPGEQITLTWEDIRVTLPAKKSLLRPSKSTPARQILRGVSGIVRPGTLLAVMGASGSGKTTLLNVLTTRNTEGLHISGDVKVNGLPVGRGITSLSAYVQQEDLFVGVLTVSEHLWFQAMLRMDSNLTVDERKLRVEEVTKELGLNKCKDTVIGVPGKVKAISGGERKRLAFASEVLTNPPLMFCDEPTSGLDSFMAENVVQTLRGMASKGKTILCTIHQPSSQVFELFDNLLLMAEGRIAYFGPGAAAKPFFAKCGFVCPERFNPADYYIRTLAITVGKVDECRERIDKICDTYEAEPNYGAMLQAIGQTSRALDGVIVSPTALNFDNVSPYKADTLTQFRHVFWRSWLTNNRNKSANVTRLAQSVIICLFVGLCYSGAHDDQQSVLNINGAIFFLLCHATFANAFSAVDVFPSELAIFKRENANGMYRTSVYFIAKTLADLPAFVIVPVLAATLVYWLGGLRQDFTYFMINVGTCVFLTQIATSFGYFVSTMAGNVSTAVSIASPIIAPFMLLGGFYINDQSIPVYFIWIQYLSWFKYANEILVVNQWSGYGNLTCQAVSNGTNCFGSGDEVIAYYSYSADNMTRNFLALLALFCGYRVLAYLFLLFRVQPPNIRKCFGIKNDRGAAGMLNNTGV